MLDPRISEESTKLKSPEVETDGVRLDTRHRHQYLGRRTDLVPTPRK